MSAQFFQSSTPAENQTIKVNDCIVRGAITCSGSIDVSGGVSIDGGLSFDANPSAPQNEGKISLPALTNYTQGTSNTTAVTITGNQQQFTITTFETSAGVGGDIASGASVNFTVNHSGIVAGKTIVLCAKAGSYNALVNVNDFVASTGTNDFTVTRHNFGAGTASGRQVLMFKLIQTA